MNRTLIAALAACLLTPAAWSTISRGADMIVRDTAVPTVEKGFQELEARDPAAAEATFKAILSGNPASVGACEGLVWTYMKMGKPDLAADMADKRLALTPNDEAWKDKRLAILAQVPARRTEVISAYRERSQAHPQDVALSAKFAELLSWTPGRLSDAVAEYRLALALTPRDHDLRLGLARALAWSGQTTESTGMYDTLLIENSTDADALLGRAQLARWSGDRALAIRLLERGTRAYPADGRFPAERSRVAMDAGHKGSALREARKAFKLSPDSAAAKEALSAAEQATRPNLGIRISGSNESTGFVRNTLGVPMEFYPFADTRLRIEPAYEKDRDNFDQINRPNIGLGIKQAITDSIYVNALYHPYFPQGTAVTQEFNGELGFQPWNTVNIRGGFRQRSIVDAPVGYEDIAYLTGSAPAAPSCREFAITCWSTSTILRSM